MTAVSGVFVGKERRPDVLSGTPRAHAIDRWIYVFTAASFIAIVLAGFIPDSLMKIGMVEAGQRPPFPLVLHMHAVLMGTYLILLLAQTSLVATGRNAFHQQLGILSMILAPAIVVVGFILIPTTYHGVWQAAQTAPEAGRAAAMGAVSFVENIMLLQIRIGILFPLFLVIGLSARGKDDGLHKRMMILAPAMALPAGLDRIPWLWTSIPQSPLTPDLYLLAALSPMIVWDLVRNRGVHPAYWILLAAYLPMAIAVHALWDTPWWHMTAQRIMGV